MIGIWLFFGHCISVIGYFSNRVAPRGGVYQMDFKTMRVLHLYLGCFFAPLLLFFVVSGCWQTFNLHHARKMGSGYKPPQIIRSLSAVHKNQGWADHENYSESSAAFRYLVLLMAVGFLITTVLGILMAFKFTRPWMVWGCLFWGTVIPCLFIWMGWVFK